MKLHEKVIFETVALEWRERIQLRPGENVFLENILKTDVLIFEPGAELHIGSHIADYVAVIAKVVYIQDGTIPSLVRVARLDGVKGAEGDDGYVLSKFGANGDNGGHGGDGTDATTPPPFLFFCDDFSYGNPPKPGISSIVVDGSGGDGANGGSGGHGGPGQNGGHGWAGLSVSSGSRCP